MRQQLITSKQQKDPIVRNRKIFSCKRCFKGKRKCDKKRPTCDRCAKTKVPCEYFDKAQLEERFSHRLGITSTRERSGKPGQDASMLQNLPNTEISPQNENENFTIIVDQTGEYSKFFPKGFFSYYDHAENVSIYVKLNNSNNKPLAIFDFSSFVPLLTDNDIKDRIPSRKVSDILIDHFFIFISPFIPIVDEQEFKYHYMSFWKKKEQFNDKNFLVILFAIYFCSCTNLNILKNMQQRQMYQFSNDKKLKNFNYEEFRKLCFQCIENLRRLLNSDTTPSLSIIIALTLIYYVGSSNGYSIPMEINTLVKYAQVFGLHRKLKTNSDNLPMRDIIYSFVWFLDGLSAYYSGFPPCMHYDFFESDNIYDLPSNDIHILYLSARLCSTLVWNRVLIEFNKVKKTDIPTFEKIETLYLNSITIVNSINQKILSNNEKDLKYRKWLVTEGRLGLRKSMLLVSALKYSISYKPCNFYNRNLTTDLVLQAMLLINESIYKVKLGLDVLKEAVWYYRFAYPFQAMYILLSHIQKYPKHALNFSNLDKELEYTHDDDYSFLNHVSGDLRITLIDSSFKQFDFLKEYWHQRQLERFERLTKFRDYVWEKNKEYGSITGSTISSFSNAVQPNFSFDTSELMKQKDKYDMNISTLLGGAEVDNSYVNDKTEGNLESFIKTELEDLNTMEATANELYDAYAFLDEGSKFWFGEEYNL